MPIFKQQSMRPVPANGTIVPEGKKAFVVYKDSKGRKRKAPLSASRDSIIVTSKYWYGETRDESGNTIRMRLSTDKKVSEQMLRDLNKKRSGRKKGQTNDAGDDDDTLQRHLRDYLAFLRSRNRTEDYIRQTALYINLCLSAVDATFHADLSAEQVAQWLAESKSGSEMPHVPRPTGLAKTYVEIAERFKVSEFTVAYWARHGAPIVMRRPNDLAAIAKWLKTWKSRGISTQTSNNRLRAIKSLTRWMLRHRRAEYDPLVCLSRSNVEQDRRHVRRSLSPEELRRLVAITELAPERFGFDGVTRSLIYRLACRTGFRRKELGSLTPRSFDFESGSLLIQAESAKNRRSTRNPLTPELILRLKNWIEQRKLTPDSLLFSGLATLPTSVMLRKDLVDAGIPYEDDHGRKFDFHALRVQFAADLARSGVNLTTAQKLMRHSDPKLTSTVYTQLGINDLKAAVNQLKGFDGSGAAIPDKKSNAAKHPLAKLQAKLRNESAKTQNR